jgi:hypothetical protein
VQWPLAVSYGTLPAGVSTRYDSYAVWVCNTPGGYITWTDLFTFSNMAVYAWRYATGTWTAAQGQADCQTSCVPPTPTEAAFQQTIMTPVRPKALVAFNGASLTRSVYTVNADGTLNGTPLPGVLVAVAAPCDETKRIPVTPLPGPQAAAYYSVAGDANTLGGTIPENSYTICSVALPIGAN